MDGRLESGATPVRPTGATHQMMALRHARRPRHGCGRARADLRTVDRSLGLARRPNRDDASRLEARQRRDRRVPHAPPSRAPRPPDPLRHRVRAPESLGAHQAPWRVTLRVSTFDRPSHATPCVGTRRARPACRGDRACCSTTVPARSSSHLSERRASAPDIVGWVLSAEAPNPDETHPRETVAALAIV